MTWLLKPAITFVAVWVAVWIVFNWPAWNIRLPRFYHRRRQAELLRNGINVTQAYGATWVTFFWQTRRGTMWKFGWGWRPLYLTHPWVEEAHEWMWPQTIEVRPLCRYAAKDRYR